MNTAAKSVLGVCMATVLLGCAPEQKIITVSSGDPSFRQCGAQPGTGTGDPSGSHRIVLELTGLPATWSCDARLRAVVYGYDRVVADVAATPLLEVVDPLPSDGVLALHFDRSDFGRIEFQSGPSATLGYYLHLSVDLDGDGVVCGTDLVRDYDESPLAFYSFDEVDVADTAALQPDGSSCS